MIPAICPAKEHLHLGRRGPGIHRSAHANPSSDFPERSALQFRLKWPATRDNQSAVSRIVTRLRLADARRARPAARSIRITHRIGPRTMRLFYLLGIANATRQK